MQVGIQDIISNVFGDLEFFTVLAFKKFVCLGTVDEFLGGCIKGKGFIAQTVRDVCHVHHAAGVVDQFNMSVWKLSRFERVDEVFLVERVRVSAVLFFDGFSALSHRDPSTARSTEDHHLLGPVKFDACGVLGPVG